MAIGLARTDPARAAQELLGLARGQWSNGMLPHMIYSTRLPYRFEGLPWGTRGLAPNGVSTSGITQPPMLAIAAERVAAALPTADRADFIQRILPVIIRSHQWIYRERDATDTGLPVALHSWESGLDDTPYWTETMNHLPPLPWQWRWLREWRVVRPEERATPRDLRHMLTLARLMKQHHYDSQEIIAHSTVVIQDPVFCSILAAANESLACLAAMAGQSLSSELEQHMQHTRGALETLWDDQTHQYYARDVHAGRLIRVPTVATFMPLFAGTASPARASYLRQLLADGGGFRTPYPLPSVPTDSRHFEPQRYWRGPVWINMNWFVIRGLERYGFTTEAHWLRDQTLQLVHDQGFREYYQPLTGQGLGAQQFSWSAALTIDLLAAKK